MIKISNPADILVREAIYFDLQYGDPSNAQVEQHFATLKSLGVSDNEILRASPGINSIAKKSPQERTAWRLFYEKMAAHPEWQWNCLMRLSNTGDKASLPVMERYLTTTDEPSLACVLNLIGRFPESASYQKAIDQIAYRVRSGNLELRSASGGRVTLRYATRYLFKTEDAGEYLATAIAPIILDTTLPVEHRLAAVDFFVRLGTNYNQTELKMIGPGLNLAFTQILLRLKKMTSYNDRFAIISHALQVMIKDDYSKEVWCSSILRATRILLDAGLAETQTMELLWKP